MNSLCSGPGTAHTIIPSQRKHQRSIPPRFTRPNQRPSPIQCTPSTHILSPAPTCQEDQSLPPQCRFPQMGFNSPGLVSQVSTILSFPQSHMSGMKAGLPASVKYVDLPLLRDNAVSRIRSVTPPPVSNLNRSFVNRGCPDSRQPDQGMVQRSPLQQMCKIDFPPLEVSGQAQTAFIKKNNEKKIKMNYSPSNFVFEILPELLNLKNSFHFKLFYTYAYALHVHVIVTWIWGRCWIIYDYLRYLDSVRSKLRSDETLASFLSF